MRIPRLYTRQILNADSLVNLDKDAARYLSSVLRMIPGQRINLFNGDGLEYVAEVVSLGKNQATASIVQSLSNDYDYRWRSSCDGLDGALAAN